MECSLQSCIAVGESRLARVQNASPQTLCWFCLGAQRQDKKVMLKEAKGSLLSFVPHFIRRRFLLIRAFPSALFLPLDFILYKMRRLMLSYGNQNSLRNSFLLTDSNPVMLHSFNSYKRDDNTLFNLGFLNCFNQC